VVGEAASIIQRIEQMKADIHPAYSDVKVTCSCGAIYETRSTKGEDFSIDVCQECHPFYTGKQKVLDTGGRIDRFNKRFGGRTISK
jgi:large subunit ribosomal protein L31